MKSTLPVIAIFVLGVLLVVSIGVDCGNMASGGSIDLRNRITGTRLFAAHQDAYHYKWTTAGPPDWCDPFNNLALPITRTTVTPSLLMLNLPLAPLSYRYIQSVWLIAQWLMFLVTAALWMMVIPKGRLRWLWAMVVTGFTFTVAWRHHTDRGQAYVVMLFLLACWMLATRHSKLGNGLIPGLVAGLLVALRPPFLLLLGPFLLLRRRGQILGAIVGLALSAGLPLLWSTSCWSDYQRAMQTWSELYRAGTFNPRPPPQAYPAQVEGLAIDTLAHFSAIPFADSSLFALFKSLGASVVPASPVLLALVLLVSIWFWCGRSKSDDILLAGVAAWSFLGDLFLPAPRNSYNDVQILNLVALGLVMARGDRPSWIVWLLLASWPLNWAVMASLPGEKWIINLPSVIMMAGAVLMLVRPPLAAEKPEPSACK